MAYQACYDCEMVYEVHAENSLCPQCNRPLVPYDYEPEVEAPAEVPPDPAPADTAEPPATVALDVSSLPPMPDLEPVAPPGGVRKSTLLGPPKPVAQPFTGDALGGIDLHNDPVTGNTDPMPAPNIPRPEESGPADLPRTMALSAGDLPDLGPLGVSSAQVPEPSPPAELPRTVALSADQLGDLPPMGEGSAPPPQQAEGERRTKAINLNDLGDVAAGLTPPGPAVAPPVEVPVIAERAAVPTGSTERQMANLGSIQPRRRKGNKKSKVGLIVGLSLLLLAGIGVALYFFVFADSGKKTVEALPPPPPAPPSWDERLETQVKEGQAVLPTVKGGARLTEGVYVAGGPEGLSTSLGPITGIMSTKLRADQIKKDDNGTWLPALQAVLDRHESSETEVLSFAVDRGTTAQHLVQMANSGSRAGFKRCALVVLRTGSEGELSSLPFQCEGTLPAQGAVIYRVGKLSDYVAAKDQANETISEGVPQVARNEDGQPNFEAIEQRLAALRTAHPTIDRVILYPNDAMTTKMLAELMARIQTAPKAARYEKMALAF